MSTGFDRVWKCYVTQSSDTVNQLDFLNEVKVGLWSKFALVLPCPYVCSLYGNGMTMALMLDHRSTAY